MELGRRATLLDAVLDDAASLRSQLPSADRARLDAHMEHLFEVQRRLSLGIKVGAHHLKEVCAHVR